MSTLVLIKLSNKHCSHSQTTSTLYDSLHHYSYYKSLLYLYTVQDEIEQEQKRQKKMFQPQVNKTIKSKQTFILVFCSTQNFRFFNGVYLRLEEWIKSLENNNKKKNRSGKFTNN